MNTLQIRNTVRDFETWKSVFDKFERFREEHGVRSYRVLRRADDEHDVQVVLDFDTEEAAVEFRGHLEQIWRTPAVAGTTGRSRRARAARGRRSAVVVTATLPRISTRNIRRGPKAKDIRASTGHSVGAHPTNEGVSMRNAYRILATIIAVEVVIQAMAMVFAIAGLFNWVDDGNTFDKGTAEDESVNFTGAAGFMIHGVNGLMIIPLLGLALLIVAFFAKVPGGVKWAAIVLGAIVLQVFLGIFGHESAYMGMLHGLNAFVLLGSAGMAARLAKSAEVDSPTSVTA